MPHQVKDNSWQLLRDEGAIIEEVADDSDGHTEEEKDGPESFDEKRENHVEVHVSPIHLLSRQPVLKKNPR